MDEGSNPSGSTFEDVLKRPDNKHITGRFYTEKVAKYYTAYASAYDNEMEKKMFSIPKIYSAKGDLTKRWYVYYSFRNPKTGKMTRQPPLTMSINRNYKTVRGRMKQCKILQKATLQALKDGFNPYEERQVSENYYMLIR